MKVFMYALYSDGELVAMTLRGDNDAYSELVTRHKEAVFRAAARMMVDYHAAEDMAQEAFVDGYMQLKSLREPNKAAAWLCGIARRKALHYISHMRNDEDIDKYAEQLLDKNHSPEELVLSGEMKDSVRNAFSTLKGKNRSVAELYYQKGVTIPDIASRLGIPVGTVKSRLFSARQKLKGELSYLMSISVKDPDFEKAVMDKIKTLNEYLFDYHSDNKAFWQQVDEVRTMAENISESVGKGPITSVIINKAINAWNAGQDNEQAQAILDQALPKVMEMGYDNGVGEIKFWLGRAKMREGDIDGAATFFEDAVRLIKPENVYRANAAAALRAIDLIQTNTHDGYSDCNVCGEGLSLEDGKLIFVSQPGWSGSGSVRNLHKFDSIFFYAGCYCKDRLFFDLTTIPGECAGEPGKRVLVAKDETVTVPAGIFLNCLHIHFEGKFQYEHHDIKSAEIYFAPNTGLVKAVFDSTNTSECYELDEYEINGGEGYFPLAVGNRWNYRLPDMPDYIYQRNEREVDWTDGKKANLRAVTVYTFRKNYEDANDLDSDVYISLADRLCDEWKLEEAIDMLRCAVRKNSTQNATIAALHGIDYLTRCADWHAKGYRFCPSSYSVSWLTEKDSTACLDEHALYKFSPYRMGGRWEDNYIWGTKALRYLQLLTKCLFDTRWAVGYTEQREYNGDALTINATEGGTVTTAAGTFEHCVKVTLSIEKADAENAWYYWMSGQQFQYIYCGVKEFWYAPGVGLVRYDFTWGSKLKSSCELARYSISASDGVNLFPINIGNEWEYDELHLTQQGYRAKQLWKIASGINGKYVLCASQEIIYIGSEEEYDKLKKTPDAL